MRGRIVGALAVGCMLATTCFGQNGTPTNGIGCVVTLEDGMTNLGIGLTKASMWDMGTVLCGAVKDTWTSGAGGFYAGPGAFEVENQGAPARLRIEAWPMSGGPRAQPALPALSGYALAVASNVSDPVPNWRLLDMRENSTSPCYTLLTSSLYTSERVAFDLKFYAPIGTYNSLMNFSVLIVAIPLD